MPKKILIFSATAGAGHLRAADAVAAACNLAHPDAVVRHIDALTFTNKAFRDVYSKAYLELVVHAPHTLGWVYDRLDNPDGNTLLMSAFNRLNLRPFIKMIEEEKPDITICTHFLPAQIISDLKGQGRLACPLVVVVTDLDVHAMWLFPNVDRYCVALDETRANLIGIGVPPERIAVTGIPIDPVFSKNLDIQQTRRELGLDPNLTTLLLSAGGFGVGPIERMITALSKLTHACQIVAICGKNADLKSRIQTAADQIPATSPVKVHVVGFTKEMDRYMSASDLLLGKPGGLTSSEALAKGLALVIVNPIPGQEERNSDHYLEEGLAIRCNNLPALAYKIDRLLGDPEKLASMRAASRALSKPDAAMRVVKVADGSCH